MPITLPEYAGLNFYQLKQNELTGNDYVRGDSTELWLKEVVFGASTPTTVAISIPTVPTTAAALDGTVISLESDTDGVTLYRGDILNFAEGILVISANTTFATAATEVEVPVLPQTVLVTGAANTYAMLPCLFVMDGGLPEFSGSEATANNKNQGLWAAKAVTGREGTLNANGSYQKADPSIEVLSRIGRGWQNLYAEARFAPYESITSNGVTFDHGTGPGTFGGLVTVQSFNPAASKAEFVQVTVTMSISGTPNPYTLLAP